MFIRVFFPSIFPDFSPFVKKTSGDRVKRWIPEFSNCAALFCDSFILFFESVLKTETLTSAAPVIV